MSISDIFEAFLNMLVLQNFRGFEIQRGGEAIDLFQVPRMQRVFLSFDQEFTEYVFDDGRAGTFRSGQ